MNDRPLAAQPKLNVVFCWHMHQPDYRDRRNGEFQLPWTYLHGIKDYVDMVAHLEHNPQARVVVNFAPILLEQVDEYSQHVKQYFIDNTVIKDPLLNALVDPTLPSSAEYRHGLIKSCLRANEQHLIARFDHYQRLADMGSWINTHPEEIHYLKGQYFVDLLMWYHLAWLGETVRHNNLRVKELIHKGCGFTFHHRRELLAIIGELLTGLIGRYKMLMDKGQIELSMSPYSHPIIPLLLDINCARQSMPDISMPVTESYPDGSERAKWHIKEGINTFKHFFSSIPRGCWLSEGGLSEAAIGLLDEFDFAWTAGGESVLRNSLAVENKHHPDDKESFLYQCYKVAEKNTVCFFRDDELSDLIGFTYSDWHGDDAVANFTHRLETIAQQPAMAEGGIVSIILDGENAWEHFPENAYHFLHGLYQSISDSPYLTLATYSDCLTNRDKPATPLDRLVAGSWVYGTFSTWIGDEQKNRAWDMLTDAKQCYDRMSTSPSLNDYQLELARFQLAICESSDWFWWFGDYNPADTVSDFERLFRMHLANLYQCLGVEPPDYLSEVFTHGSGSPFHGGVMRTGSA